MIRASTVIGPALCRRSAIPRTLVAITPAWMYRDMSTSTPRRRRSNPSKYPLQDHSIAPDPGGLRQAFAHGEEDFDTYLEKASLSPWVPVPDPIARKMLEIARAGPDDIHVELGSGDGRMNFHALDAPYNVKRSIGIDIDEKLVAMSEERLARRHPRPDNLTFRVEDLMQSSVWHQDIQQATVITMFFVEEALLKLKPALEAALKDRQGCRVVCCGYEMPGWEAQWVEVILDLPIYMYTFNTPIEKIPSLTPDELAKLKDAFAHQQGQQSQGLLLDEKPFPMFGQHDDIEEIEVPLFDPNEMIDGHWDDFDKEVEDDLDGNPAISKWRKPQ